MNKKPIHSSAGSAPSRPARRSFLAQAGMGMGAAVLGGLPGVSLAAGKPEVTWKAVLQHRNGAQYKKWLWLETELPKRTDGRLALELTTIPELGLTGSEMLRVMKSGLIDIAEVLSGYVASDFPAMEAPELPGLISSTEQSRRIYDAWTEKFVSQHEDRMGGSVVSTFSYGTMPVFTRFPLNSLEDFKGKKIRVFSPAQARYITALGGEPLSMPIADVYSALQRGIMDGLITGFEWVEGMKMWEIAGHVSDIHIAPMGCYIVASKKGWAKLSPDLQKAVTDIAPELTDMGWAMGQENVDTGLALAREHKMTIQLPSKPEWRPALKQISTDNIVPWWAERTGKVGKDAFNELIAPIVDIRVA
jgi:TRAP-type C4-dicarboxylate transport system substrate-binding protein